MRSRLIAVVSGALGVALMATHAHSADAPAVAPATSAAPLMPPPKVGIEGERIVINGKAFSLPCERADLEALLGKPDREADLTNLVLTWDHLGLIAYVIKESGPAGKDGKSVAVATTKVRQVTIALDKDETKTWPAKLFAGGLTIDGALVTSKTDVTELNLAKKGDPFKKHAGIAGWYIIERDTSLVVLRMASDKVGTKDAKLACVSFDARLAKSTARK